MARANSTTSSANDLESSNPPSRFAILSQTEVQSPDVRLILPARIRDWHKNDVVLICDHALFVKEILDTDRLSHVAAKTDFTSRIRAASVLKLDHKNDINGSKESRGSTLESPPSTEPSQALVLSMDKPPRIAFLVLVETPVKAHQFLIRELQLPVREAGALHELGELLATDPSSRAIAVSSRSNYIFTFQVTNAIGRATSAEDIIRRERCITSRLTSISKMDFLYTGAEQSGTVYLLLIGHRNKKCHLELISWKLDEDTDRPESCELINLSDHHDMPTILAPLITKPGAFVLACNRSVAIYDGAFLANIRPQYCKAVHQSAVTKDKALFFDGSQSNEMSRSQEPYLWKSWARASRNEGYSEWMYLARQDGLVCYLSTIKNSTGELISKSGDAGHLGGNVDQAFAYVLLHGTYDALLFFGDLCDGGLFQIGFYKDNGDEPPDRTNVMSFKKTEVLYNWSPILDTAILPESSPMPSPLSINHVADGLVHKAAKRRLFAPSGKSPHGSVTELRLGSEMSVHHVLKIENDVRPTKLWVFKVHIKSDKTTTEPPEIIDFPETLLVLSMPSQTSILSGIYQNPRRDVLCEDETLTMQELLNRRSRMMIQVKSHELQLLQIVTQRPYLVRKSTFKLPKVSHAVVDPHNGFVVMSVRDTLMLKQLTVDDELFEIGEELQFEADITTIAILSLSDHPTSSDLARGGETSTSNVPRHAAVGFASGTIRFFEIDPEEGLIEAFKEKEIQSGPNQSVSTPESINMISSPVPSEWMIICGMRDGIVYALRVYLDDAGKSYRISDRFYISIGVNPIQLTRHFQNPYAIIAQCGGSAVYIDYGGRNIYEPMVMPIWITARGRRSFSPNSVESFLQIARIPGELNIPRAWDDSGDFLFTSDEEILIGSLEKEAKPVPRQFRVPGTPTRILYSTHFQCFFVASRVVKRRGIERYDISALYVVDVHDSAEDDTEDEKSDQEASISPIFILDNGLDLMSLSDIKCQEGSKRSYFVVLGARDNRKDKEKGSLQFLKFSRDADGDLAYDDRKVVEENHPVLATYGCDGNILLYGSGTNLCEMKISTATGRYDESPRYERRIVEPAEPLMSNVLHISVNHPFVYVSSEKHSLSVFRWEGHDLKRFKHDDTARLGLCNLPLKTPNFVLFTDKGQRVVGMDHGFTKAIKSTCSPAFEATLQRSVTKLDKVNCRQPWKMHSLKGVVERDIVGTTTDGSLYAFSILTERLWRLLRFTQNLCMAHPSICNVVAPISGQAKAFEPASGSAKDFHIDGDVLKRLFDVKDPYGHFRRMLSDLGRPEDVSRQKAGEGNKMADDRRRRLTELVNDYDYLDQNTDNEPGDPTEITRRQLEQTMGENDTESRALKIIQLALDSPF